MKQIFYRIISIILTCIFLFSTACTCYAADTSSDEQVVGWNNWSINEKISYVGKYGYDLICALTGIAYGDRSGFEELIKDTYVAKKGVGVESFYNYLAENIVYDDNTQIWSPSDDLVSFLNQFIVEYNDRVTMQYRYPVNVNNLTADNFPNKALYQGMVDLSNAFPNCYFYFYSYSGVGNPDSFRGKGYREQNGSWGAHFPYSSDADGLYLVGCVESPFACTTNYMDIFSSPVTFYNDGWSASNSTTRIFLIRPCSSTDYDLWYQDSFYSDYMLVRINDLSSLNLNDIPLIRNTPSLPLYLSSQYKSGYSFNVPISSSTEAINCYKSVADMKKDIGSQTVGTYHPNYTGTTHNYISQTEINNYYPPAPDDPSPVPGDTVDYTEYLQFIFNEIQKINTSLSELDTSCDHSVIEGYLAAQNSRLDDLYYLLNNIYLLCQVPDQSDNSDILDALNVLTDKLVNIQHSLDNPDYSDITDRLDDMEETVSDMKDLLDDQNETLDDIKDIVNGISDNMFDFSNMDENIHNTYITVQKISSTLDEKLLQSLTDGFSDLKESIDNINDTLQQFVSYSPGDDSFDFNDIVDLLSEIDEHLEKIIKQLRLNNFLTGVDTLMDALSLFYDIIAGELTDLTDEIFNNKSQLNGLTNSLSTKFPFSLPYDLFAILNILVADPVDPVFEVPFRAGQVFNNGNYLIDEKISLDFTEFHKTIEVFRFFIQLYWIVGLLFLTPKFINKNGG